MKRCLLIATTALAINAPAHATVRLVCHGKTLLADGLVDGRSALSLTIDDRAGTVTVGGFQPVGILPSISTSPSEEEVGFIGSTSRGLIHGDVNRITGRSNITLQGETDREQFFSGICRTAQKIF